MDNISREEFIKRLEKLGYQKVYELIQSNYWSRDIDATAVAKTWLNEKETIQKMKITLKDYIGWAIGILGAISAIAATGFYINAKLEIRQFQGNKQEWHNQAQIIQQYITTNNYNVPKNVIEAANLITSGTAPGKLIFENSNK